MKHTDFFASPTRKRSPEADYGVNWTDGSPWPRYRVSYIRATGEVYAFNHSNADVVVLAIIPPDPAPATGIYYLTLDRILDGWAEQGHDLSWVRERLNAAMQGRHPDA